MNKRKLKTNPIKLILILFFMHLIAFSQNQLSVPFPAGFIGVKGSNTQQANTIKTFVTLGITKAFFMQNSTLSTFQVQGNDVSGTLRLQLNSGQLIDIPGAMVWKNDNLVDYLGFIPSAGFSSVSFSYGAGLTYTIYGTSTTSNIGLGLIGGSFADFVDNSNISGNASGFLDDLNNYLATTNLDSNKPDGPITVVASTEIDTTPTITGIVTLSSGETLSIDINNVLYTTSNGLSVDAHEWTLTIPNANALAIDTYSVVAKITNSTGYILNDTTSNELKIIGIPTVETLSGTAYSTSITVFGNVNSENASSVTERGFVYSTSPNPTTTTSLTSGKVISGTGSGDFSQSISGLTSGTLYYVRTYATNSGGTSYGSEMSFTTIGVCGGEIIGSGLNTDPSAAFQTDANWKVVALPQEGSFETYNAYVPLISDLNGTNISRTGYTVSGKTYYWIAPKTNATGYFGPGVYYNWIVQQTFTVARSGFYDLNFSGAGDNAISFYINGEIDRTDSLFPIITGGTQIGSKHNSFTELGNFSGVAYLNAGVNTASMVMEDYGGDTNALISGSTFTCNTTYTNVIPVISTIGSAALVDGEVSAPIEFTISDLETPLNNLTLSVISSNTDLVPNSNVVISGNTGKRTIAVSPVSGQTGSSTITITLDDNAGGVITKSFVITMEELALNRYGQFVSDPAEMVDMYGGKGTGKGQNQFGKKINKALRPNIGDAYLGGVIAYILVPGDHGYNAKVQHGLIAATSDQSDGIQWYNGSDIVTGATDTNLGTGLANTNKIIKKQGVTATNYAAGLARAYNGGGYTDWYLPSKEELYKLYLNKVAIGNFSATYYWSSTEGDNSTAWIQDFNSSNPDKIVKRFTHYVRAIRSF